MVFIKKKSLGQHFLASSAIAGKIADAATLSKNDIVLEVGPGEGMLTKELLARAKKVIAIEKDDRLIEPLTLQFKKEISSGKLTLVHADALQFDISNYFEKGHFIVVANIPYYITGALMRKLLEGAVYPKRMVLLLQKEVAERIARDKKESLLSLSVKAYGKPQYVATVKRGSFSPAPSIDSAILKIDDISKKNFSRFSEKHFFGVLKAGFAHKRKLLRGNLASFGKEEALSAMEVVHIQLNARAEDIPIRKWLELAERLAKKSFT